MPPGGAYCLLAALFPHVLHGRCPDKFPVAGSARRLERQLSNSHLAVGVGFEPTDPVRINGFQDRHVRPLRHPTVALITGLISAAVLRKNYRKRVLSVKAFVSRNHSRTAGRTSLFLPDEVVYFRRFKMYKIGVAPPWRFLYH